MTAIELQWREEFEPVLRELDAKLENPGFRKDTRLVARALLRLLKHGDNFDG